MSKYYYDPTPRRQKDIPSRMAVVLVCGLIASILIWCLWAGSRGYIDVPTEAEQRPVRKITHDSLTPTYTYNGETIRTYVLIDPDTGLQYLVSDRGGITERMGTDGKQMGTPK